MIPVAGRIRREAGVPTGVGWMITDPLQAEAAVRDEQIDLVILARAMLRDPYWPYHAAQKLGLEKAGRDSADSIRPGSEEIGVVGSRFPVWALFSTCHNTGPAVSATNRRQSRPGFGVL